MITLTCRMCLEEWQPAKKPRGQVPFWCPTCRPKARRVRSREDAAKYRALNREHLSDMAKRRYAANPEKYRAVQLKIKYNLTPEGFDALLASQGGCCGICSTPESTGRGWHVDHNHETGKVRGVLCHQCNTNLVGGYEKLPAELRDWPRMNEYLSRIIEHDPLLTAVA